MSIKSFLKKKISPEHQISEAFLNSALLALSGGLMDAYTYMVRGGAFANAETGNIVLFGMKIIERDFSSSVKYLASILAFALGIFVVENFRFRFKNTKKLHWRQYILIGEIAILIIVGLLPEDLNLFANILVAFSAAVQVQTFRKVDGFSFASTMCTGNLRSGTDALSVYLRERKKPQLIQALHYYGIIILFSIGAGVGGLLSGYLGLRTIWVSCTLLLISFVLMAVEE